MMIHRQLRRSLTFLLLPCVLWSIPARADSKRASNAALSETEQTEARERYTRGMQLVSEGNFQAALIEMQRAYSLNPSYKILYNLGQIQLHLNDYAAAATAFERYLSEGGAELPAPRVSEVRQELDKLKPRIASVDLDVKGDGGEVLLDDVAIGTSPLRRTVLVNAGKHKFSVARAGKEPVTRVIPLAGQDEIRVELDVSNPAAGRAVAASQAAEGTAGAKGARESTSPSEPHENRDAGPSYTWVGWTLSAAFAAGAGVAGVIALGKNSDLKDLRNSPTATRQGLDDAQSSTFKAALVTDVLLGASLVTAGVTLYFTLSSKSDSAPEHHNQDVALSLTPNGVWLGGKF